MRPGQLPLFGANLFVHKRPSRAAMSRLLVRPSLGAASRRTATRRPNQALVGGPLGNVICCRSRVFTCAATEARGPANRRAVEREEGNSVEIVCCPAPRKDATEG